MPINRRTDAASANMVSPPSLPSGYARMAPIHALGKLVRILGKDADKIFRAARIDERDIADPDGVLPVAVRGELLARAALATGCEHFGLLLGAQSGIRELGAAGQLMLERSSVGEALEVLAAFWLLHNPTGVVFVGRSGDQATFGYAVMDGNIPGLPQVQDGAMAFALNIMRDLLGADWRPAGVTLMRREPSTPAFHEQFFSAPCRFNAMRSELIFPVTTLDFRLKHSAAGSVRIAQRPPDGQDWGAYVQRVAYQLLLQGECSQKRVATALGISNRTLVRNLASFGVTFQQLSDGVRYSASRSLIRETNLALAEIAGALGYKEASSFSRAFQRWSGMSPAQWRKLKVEQVGLYSGKK